MLPWSVATLSSTTRYRASSRATDENESGSFVPVTSVSTGRASGGWGSAPDPAAPLASLESVASTVPAISCEAGATGSGAQPQPPEACDGKQPCTHCSVYSYECTYDQPSNRKKAPDGLKTETKLKCAESVLEQLLPGVDIYSPTFDLQAALASVKSGTPGASAATSASKSKRSPAAGFAALRSESNAGSVLQSPSSDNSAEFRIILPPKFVAVQLIEAVWENACVLFRFYHRPSFIRDLDLLYESEPEDYTDKQYRILPLVYSIMAVGVLFSMDKSEQLGFKDASEGYKYFVAARRLIDITDTRDVHAIQSIVMMILFLQCSARLSTCYSYIGIALRAALRAGLHRKVNYNFNPIDLETRKRLFWTIRKMDVYVNSVLGLPLSISEEDFDQDLPEEIDDENITEDAYYPQKENKLSSAGIANAHTRLMTILGHILKKIYPVNPGGVSSTVNNPTGTTSNSSTNGEHPGKASSITYSKIVELEKEIDEWQQSLPDQLKHGADVRAEYLKANRLLSLAYCYVLILLYRPFIHYLSPSYGHGHQPAANYGDERAKYYARKCIVVSRQVVHIAHDMVSHEMLNGAYWFSVYTVFFSVACLVFYSHENFNEPDALEVQLDAELGKSALDKLKDNSTSASRTYNLLNGMFDQLNKRTAKLRNALATKEGAAAGSENINSAIVSSVSMPEVANYGTGDDSADGLQRRASVVFPDGGKLLERLEFLAQGFPAVGGFQIPATQSASNDHANSNTTTSSNPTTVTTAATSDNDAASEHNASLLTGDINPAATTTTATGIEPITADGALSISSTDFIPQNYVPGLMDQVDTQLFGRFLPPYMMQSANTTTAPHHTTQSDPFASTTNSTSAVNDELPEDVRRGSISSIFSSRSWDDFISQNAELSGMNSFMNF
ncbi:Asg1p [Sugiyamaella lignohabitans]|uniref:Asg1p n=1 Tax=Sugiyamaella lignohabitans TaxID=796027 RepID=A0A167DJ03_9ASCO|nr:Asg1p [Sugiyamaella lignohabitans]ANB12971.1 Asg1p [Sugiyamaella lignohabitans]